MKECPTRSGPKMVASSSKVDGITSLVIGLEDHNVVVKCFCRIVVHAMTIFLSTSSKDGMFFLYRWFACK
jgi:hypothetical protein